MADPIPCPICKGSGGVSVEGAPDPAAGASKTTGRCSLCWGIGKLPPLEAYATETDTKLALHYWSCNCPGLERGDIRPGNQDYCVICGAEQDEQPSAPVYLVLLWLVDLGAETPDILWVEQAPVEAPAEQA